ncbi:LysR family transcriptional regulator [Serratia inhibens]|uniref:LysR family transcriptional regulator n=1 Tax=Serratia inhibens TaxID=2338073 RepID=UPI003217B246
MRTQFAALSINMLQVLHAVLTTRNLSHAAEKLNSSQPQVSRQLAQLREAFGDPLLVRHGREYFLSPRGQEIIFPLEKLINELKELSQKPEFDPLLCSRCFRFASSDYVAEHMLPQLVDYLQTVAPKVSVEYFTWKPNDYPLLANAELDLATTMIKEAPTGLRGRILGEDVPVCVMSERHALAGQVLEAKDYASWRHVRVSGGGDKDSCIARALKEYGIYRQVALTVPFFSAAMEVVSNSNLLVTIPKHIAIIMAGKYNVTWRPIDFVKESHRYWMIWHERTHMEPEHKWFRNVVREIVADSSFGITKYNSNNM